jgi:hypothetical protein
VQALAALVLGCLLLPTAPPPLLLLLLPLQVCPALATPSPQLEQGCLLPE